VEILPKAGLVDKILKAVQGQIGTATAGLVQAVLEAVSPISDHSFLNCCKRSCNSHILS
jgi:hypothetical protein